MNQQKMDYMFFFNYDQLFSQSEDFDLDVFKLQVFNEEELESWGMTKEIEVLDLPLCPQKSRNSQLNSLSGLAEEEEESKENSVDLSEQSLMGDFN